MIKIALLIATFIALANARPGFLHGHHHHHLEYPLIHHEPLHVAKIVHVPAAISHQSSTVIHSAPHHIIKPVVLPIVKTVVHPIVKAYHPLPLHFDPFHHHHHLFHDHHDFHDFHHFH